MIVKLLLIIFIVISITYFCNYKNLLLSKSGEAHQNFIETKSTPLIGGIILFISIIIFGIKEINLFFFFTFAILVVGIFSDIKKNISPTLRLILQTLIILVSIYLFENTIRITNYELLDHILKDKILSIFFTTFCILILINGTNFIDGTNFNVIGYYLILIIILLYFENFDNFYFLNIKTLYLILPLIIISFLNLLNKVYLGDSGSYFLGFIFGFELINFFNQNTISPFFIILLLWYPCFEMLFSIFRKLNFKKSPLKPDSKHFHQLLYFFFYQKIKKPVLSSNLSGLIINIYNLVVLLFALIDPAHTQLQIILILLNLTIYVFIYLRLIKYRFKLD